MSGISLSWCRFRLWIWARAALQSLPDLQASSWPSAPSPAAASTQSSPSSGPQSFPPPEYLVSQCLHPSPLHASSLERNHLTPVKWESYACVIWTFKQVVQGQQPTRRIVYLYDSLQLAVLLQQPCLFLLQGENVLCRLLQDGSLWEENRIKF